MVVRIVDRRYDSRNKSATNRGRFLRRFRGQIRRAVAEAITRRSIREIEKEERIGIPARDISEPQFAIGAGGRRMRVLPGNDRFIAGDELERPIEAAGSGAGKGASSEGIEEFAFTLSKDEFLDIFFDDLALPELVKTQLARIREFRRVRAGYTQTGVPTNINIVRSLRGAAGRRVAIGGPHAARLRELEERLDRLLEKRQDADDGKINELREEIARLRARIEGIPFIDTFDLRYSNRILVPQPSTQAVMFCLMDVSGSMDEQKRQIAKRFFMLLYIFLTRTYEHIDVIFIRHHTQAFEVDEDEFFHSRETGGTVVSTALELMHRIIRERYSTALWNIYGAQASDGDNWENDSAPCKDILADRILPLVQYFAYIEIAEEPQNLWQQYELLAASQENFALQRILGLEDIYPVFRELFRKRL